MLKKLYLILLILSSTSVLAGETRKQSFSTRKNSVEQLEPTGKGFGQRSLSQPLGFNRAYREGVNGITYHGGPVMLGKVNVYFIWYGNWKYNTAPTILKELIESIGGTYHYNINTTYYDRYGRRVYNGVAYKGAAYDNYSYGKSLSDWNIRNIVYNAILLGKLPRDPNGVYFVLTSKDVNAKSGFCTIYCGWHTYSYMHGTHIKYSFVGNSDRCPDACNMHYKTSPNNNTGADGMASVLIHELVETVTDPLLNAWYDRYGQENADKCAWSFGRDVKVDGNGAYYNITLRRRNFLLQRNWVNAGGGYCDMRYPK